MYRWGLTPYLEFREARSKLPHIEGQGPSKRLKGALAREQANKPAKLPFHKKGARENIRLHKKGARERARLLLADIHLHIKGALGRARDHLQNDQPKF